MPKRKRPGHYEVGRVEPKGPNGPRPRRTGTYGVIKGKNANENGHLEWSHICEGALHASKWFAYRVGPGDNGTGTRTDLLKMFDTKTDAVEYLERRKDFDETY